MTSKQQCPHCQFNNYVFGLYQPGSGNGQDKPEPPQVVCGKCGGKFAAKEEKKAMA